MSLSSLEEEEKTEVSWADVVESKKSRKAFSIGIFKDYLTTFESEEKNSIGIFIS